MEIPQEDNMIYINRKEKHLIDNKGDEVNTPPEKKNIFILGGSMIDRNL